MAITTVDGALAGMQPCKLYYKAATGTLVAGRPHSLWYLAGIPGPGAADTSTANGVVRSSTSALVNGQIPHYDPGSGNSYLARFVTQTNSNFGVVRLCDRLWDCGANSSGSALSPTAITSQTVNSATWPARDNTGTTSGVGVQVALEVSSVLGAGTPTWTLTYTNSGSTGSRTGTNIVVSVASAIAGAFYEFGWQAGDVGVKSIQSVQSSATSTSGQWVLVAYRVLAVLDVPIASSGNAVDLLTSGFPQIFNGTVPFIIFTPTGTTSGLVLGAVTETQG